MTKNFDHAGYQKKRRDAAKARGDCVQCCRRPAVTGKARCDDCLDSQAQWQARYLGHAEAGGRYCTMCNERGHDSRRCPMVVEWYVPPSKGPWCDECLASGFHRVGCRCAPKDEP